MFSEKVKEIREKEGLTQDEFARDIFVSRTTVTKWETGKSLPNIDTLKLISEKYGVSIDELLHNEAESGFYKGSQRSFGNMELTRKQKIIAFIVFFAIAAIVFTSISVSQIKNSPTNFSEDEINNYREAMKIVPEILDEWTKEKGYCYRGLSTSLGVADNLSQSGYGIYETEEDKEQYHALYTLYFYTNDSSFLPEVTIYGTDTSDCVKEAVSKMEDAVDLIKRISGRDIDMNQIRRMAEDALDDIQNKPGWKTDPEGQGLLSSGTSLVDLELEKIDHEFFTDDFYEGKDYMVKLSLSLDYHLDMMN